MSELDHDLQAIDLGRLNPRAISILRQASLWSDAYQSGYVGSEHLLLALIEERRGPAYDVLTWHTNVDEVLRDLKQFLAHREEPAQKK